MANKCYVTKNGLKIVSHRLLSDVNSGGLEKYSGRVEKIRLWYSSNTRYIDAPIVTSFATTTDDIVPYSFGSGTDQSDTSYTYDKITISFKAIIPYVKYYYENGSRTQLTSGSVSITKIELITETGQVFAEAEASTTFYTINYNTRYTLDWDVEIGNDKKPKEWSDWQRSMVTKYGLYCAGNRLLYDGNYSPPVTPPVGIYLHKYGRTILMNDTTDAVRAYKYTGAWAASGNSATIGLNHKLQIMASNVFTAIYIDLDTASSDLAADDYRVVVEYYNGSWTTIPSISEGTQKLTVDGYIEWHAPQDWTTTTDPVAGTFTGYPIRISIYGSGLTTSPVISVDSSEVYYAGIDSDDDDPGNVQSLSIADLPHAFDSGPPKALISARFSSSDIGYKLDDDGYLESGNLPMIRGMSLTNYNALKRNTQDPVYVSSVNCTKDATTGAYRLEIPTATYPLRPYMLLLVRDNTNGKVIKIKRGTYSISAGGGFYYFNAVFDMNASHSYSLWYMPKWIDLTGEDIYKIQSVYGPAKTYSRASNIISGYVNSDVFAYKPSEIAETISSTAGKFSVDPSPFEKRTDIKNYSAKAKNLLNRHWGGWGDAIKGGPYTPSEVVGMFGDRISGSIDYIKNGDRSINHTKTYNYSQNIEDKRKIKIPVGNSGTALFSYSTDNKWLATMVTFDNAGDVGKDMKLELGMSHYTMQNANGSDIYIWKEDTSTGGTWDKIGSVETEFRAHNIFLNTYDISSDIISYGGPIHILIISKFPNFTSARGLMVKGDIPDENLNLSYEKLYEEFNNSLDSSYNNVAKPLLFSSNSAKYDVLVARIVGMGTTTDGSNSRYIQGLDYIYDSTNSRISILEPSDAFANTNYSYNNLMISRSLYSPSIRMQTDIFTQVGSASPSGDVGVWHDGNVIYENPGSASFNFEFALSKVPYNERDMVTAICDKNKTDTFLPDMIDLYWKSGYEYGAGAEYSDNHIRSTTMGHGCYVAQLKQTGWVGNTFGPASTSETNYVPATVSITYPYLVDNYYEYSYIEDTDAYTFGKAFFEANSFDTPFQPSSRDRLNAHVTVRANWPREKEPYKEIEEEES